MAYGSSSVASISRLEVNEHWVKREHEAFAAELAETACSRTTKRKRW